MLTEIILGIVVLAHLATIFFDLPDLGIATSGVAAGLSIALAIEFATTLWILAAIGLTAWAMTVIYLVED